MLPEDEQRRRENAIFHINIMRFNERFRDVTLRLTERMGVQQAEGLGDSVAISRKSDGACYLTRFTHVDVSDSRPNGFAEQKRVSRCGEDET